MPAKQRPNDETWDRIKQRYRDGEDYRILAQEANLQGRYFLSLMGSQGVRRMVPRSIKPRYDNPPQIIGDTLAIGDLQIPFHDADFLNRCLELANSWNIKHGILAGDGMNQTAFSYFKHDPKDTWAEERNITKQVYKAMHEAIGEWLWLKGNHDALLIKELNEQFDMGDIVRLLDRPKGFRVTDYFYCIVNKVWRVSHPRNISVIHGRIPATLCNKYQMNVISFHGHLVGIVPSMSGKWVAIDGGVGCDPMRLDYYAERDSTRPAMNQGAVIIKKGDDGKYRPFLLTPDSDWLALRRLY